MIKRLKYHEIDFEKYDKCIENSVQRNYYAQKKILNQLSASWEILVKDDYEAVMPIHIKKRLGFELVDIPLFCQQLGVFSLQDNFEVNDEFLNFFENNFRVIYYAFNAKNQFSKDLKKRKNYSISVAPYQNLYKKYSKGRKSAIKSSQLSDYQRLEFDENVLSFILCNLKGLNSKKDFITFEDYLRFLHNEEKLEIYGVHKNHQMVTVALLIREIESIYLLALITDEKYKNDNGSSFLLDRIISGNIEKCRLNMMGGNIRGIEIFFKSFGAQVEYFPIIQNSMKDLMMSSLFRI